MRIFQINTSVNTGSTGRIAEEIGQTVIANGMESYIAYGRIVRDSQSSIIRIGNDWDVKCHVLATRLWDKHGFSSTHATKRFIDELKKVNPNIIHFHNLHGYYLNVEVLFNYLFRVQIPIVWTLHDCWPMTGHCSYFDYVNCNKWETECCKCPNLKGYPATLFIDKSKENFIRKKRVFTSVCNITFVTPSHWLKGIVEHSYFNSYPVKVIHNGVDLKVFEPQKDEKVKVKYGLSTENKIILGVASIWDRRKGLTDFIRMNQMLAKNEQIVLVGLNKDQIRSLPKGIVGVSRTENMYDLAALYSVADVFVNPTWVDNFPTTNIEALACGTPVVTYQTGGSPEAISKDTGRIVEKGNVEALYQAVSEILEKGKRYYQPLCRKRVESFFNKEERYQDYIELYKSLL